MTIGRARATLSLCWILGSAPLILLAVIWTVLSKSVDWQLVWSWLCPLVGPQLSIIVAVWSATGIANDDHPVKAVSVFWGTIVFSALYFAALYAVVFLSPLSDNSLDDLLKKSGWYLAFIQGFANFGLGKFFIESQR